MFRPYIFWPWCSGIAFLLVGLVVARSALRAARGLEKLVTLGPTLVAAPLAAFGAGHFVVAQYVQNDIPAWIPARLFFAYFVGAALYAAATSFVLRRFVLLSASLLALMFLVFVLSMHVPNALRTGDRFAWTVALRDLSFGAGALALAAVHTQQWRIAGTSPLATAGRVVVAAALLVFGVLHVLHPLHAPGVPLQKMTPPWIPAPAAWGVVTGALELVAGGLLLAERHGRAAAAWLGLLILLLVLVVYLPFVAVAVESADKMEALNFVWDTVLFAGTVLLVAGSARNPRPIDIR